MRKKQLILCGLNEAQIYWQALNVSKDLVGSKRPTIYNLPSHYIIYLHLKKAIKSM